MKLNELEKAVFRLFVDSEGFGSIDLEPVEVANRNMTDVGFMTVLMPNQFRIEKAPPTFNGGRVGAILNGCTEVGFLIAIKDRFVDFLEGYTYGGEEWPKEITSFTLHLVHFSPKEMK